MTTTMLLRDDPLAALNQRLSTPARNLGEPGPTAEQLDQLLSAAIRVPDHGKLTPWRMLLVRGDARIRLGERLADIHARIEPDVSPSKLAKDRERYSFAPLIVVVIARIDEENPKVPVQEQILSAGCVAYNLLIGAQAIGMAAQWLTGWAAYDADAAALFGLSGNERIVAFVHIGTPREPMPERTRPLLGDVVGEWRG
ncbi:MAG TPA: nitroreductase [Rudaea sp.]|jgi:nitroreductase|nr:nitroreductase [Rudaea sp.]